MTDTCDVVATTRLHLATRVISVLVTIGFGVASVVTGDARIIVGTLAMAAYTAWDVSKTVWRIRLSDGLLELQYLSRRRVVPLTDVVRIRYEPRRKRTEGSTSPMFFVYLADRSSFRIAATDGTRVLVDAVRRRRPGIAVEESIW